MWKSKRYVQLLGTPDKLSLELKLPKRKHSEIVFFSES